MKPKDFRKLVQRDGYCLHCGETQAVAPNHRANRGMGGSKSLDVPSNIVLLCSQLNGLIESDARYRNLALHYGWKVSKFSNPAEIPVFDLLTGVSYLLNDDWSRIVFPTERETFEYHETL